MTKILVVDDSVVDRRLVGGILGKEPVWTIEEAADGRDALEKMKQALPDVVVTDLQMPSMDGLELVGAIRARYPNVPVILMTAFGSEALAVEALEEGAASYVPKSQVADILASTVKQVTALALASRSHERLIECLTRAEFSFSLDNDVAVLESLVDLVQQMVAGMGVCDTSARLRVGVALEQALRNALFHGNLQLTHEQMEETREQMLQGKAFTLFEQRRQEAPYCHRRIYVDVRLTADEARFVVRDEGPGFDTASLPERGDPAALEQPGGRGLVLMRAFMDEISYNATGNEVTMVKRRAAVLAAQAS